LRDCNEKPDIITAGDAHIPAGIYRMGMPDNSDDFANTGFAFDAEKPGCDIEIKAFNISKTLVSNEEYQQFIEAGGYENPDYWSWSGKKWLQKQHNIAIPPAEQFSPAQHPKYWRNQDGQWQTRFFDQWQTLIPEHPVMHVTYWEAEAFCNWAGRRLPTEYEWEAAALGNQINQPHKRFPWGDSMDPSNVNMDAQYLGQIPVTALAAGDSPFGCRQMLGTAWEWTSSQFLPYDGFKVDMYPFMSTLQFGYHKVCKGGSGATSSILIRGSYRQAYLPERNDVYVGFRTCARD
jgi:iron(II)-dependent oxidoreductase